jgi:hypothetical protein
MARSHGYKRLTRKARHLIRHLKRTKHATVQDQMVHELRHEVSRTHGFRGPKKAPDLGKAGRWRPLTRKAKQLLTRLRKAKVWQVQKQLVTELSREIERGRRRVDRVRRAAKRGHARVRAGAQRTRRAYARFRSAARRGQERLLTRAERKQAEREKRGPRRAAPARATLRWRLSPGRARSALKQWRWARTTPRDHAWEQSRYNAQSPRYRPAGRRRGIRPARPARSSAVPAPARPRPAQAPVTRPFPAVSPRRAPRARRALRARART